jgi:hypothetical protein
MIRERTIATTQPRSKERRKAAPVLQVKTAAALAIKKAAKKDAAKDSHTRTPHQRMLEHCAESGLDVKDVKALGLQAFSDDEALKLDITHKRAGYKIPYPTIDGDFLRTYGYRMFDTKQTGFLCGFRNSGTLIPEILARSASADKACSKFM